MLQHYTLARYRRFSSRSKVILWQKQKIAEHLKWLCQHSPFYRELKGLPLESFPIMDKALMMENLDNINTKGLKSEQLMSVAIDAECSRNFDTSIVDGVTVGLSSGTSGQRGLFLADRHEKHMWAGNILAKLLPGLWQKHRIALALRANSPLYQTVERGPIQFFYADLNKTYQDWIKELDDFQPTLLIGSAQALQLCALYSGTFSNKKMSPKRIISGAEVLTPADKMLIEKTFHCEMHEVYQCTEGFLACTDGVGQMRWNQDIVYIEKQWLNSEKTHYSPIITDFCRRTQPIIRYRLDDVILAKEDDSPFEPIGAIAGRCGDCLTLSRKGDRSIVLPDLVYRAVMLELNKRVDYRITQAGSSLIKIESKPGYHAAINSALQKLFHSLELDPVVMEYLPTPIWTPINKQRRVVNKCGF
nr:F390 synthetase-related protein [Vibrio sp. 03-59-1]